ncbi:hypothetical protein [Arachidicoccus sp.]|jgi:hypothetical protein|uniref:hypothetical protein n=1 Tax=Arachidicoccus sp. TaxID=1872624 RepID=UPI003D244E0C
MSLEIKKYDFVKPRVSNIWRAWLSTTIGLLIPVLTGIASRIMNGTIDWNYVKMSLIATAILALTDLLQEVKRRMDARKMKRQNKIKI